MAVFRCSACQHMIPTPDAHLGKSAKCPKCGERGQVEADVSSSIPVAEPASNSAGEILAENVDRTPQLPAREANPIAGPVPLLPVWASMIIVLSFSILATLTVAGVMLFFLTLSQAQGAPQEVAAGAILAALFIAGYHMVLAVQCHMRQRPA